MRHTCLPCRSLALATAFSTIALLAAPAQQSNSGKATGSSNGHNLAAEVRTEKIKFKQEFGPQTAARRGDRMSAATQPSQGNAGKGSGRSSAAVHQEFGPQVHAPRNAPTSTVQPVDPGGNPAKSSVTNTAVKPQ
jgi:hypothetical protein